MARAADSLIYEDEENFEWKQDTSINQRRDARRSLELYLERKALKRQLEDTFDENASSLNDLDW
ncbi:PA3496 family putative envelope integrity protein [Thiorhodospira sibirica]|uniref:PA3496 family putative envelope integrity protein n=1 Tax=Thiorhodospira sibirica TaxID=154347 RepID=UPI00022C22E6|nr:hypothetical protein [Thiorhodospira sibirica]